MKQRVLNELRAAWNKLLQWELPQSADDLRPPRSTSAATNATSASVNTPARQPRSSASTLNLSRVSRGGGEVEAHRRSASAVAAASSRLGALGGDVSRLCDRLMSRFVRRVTGDHTATVHVVDTPQVRTAAVLSATARPRVPVTGRNRASASTATTPPGHAMSAATTLPGGTTVSTSTRPPGAQVLSDSSPPTSLPRATTSPGALVSGSSRPSTDTRVPGAAGPDCNTSTTPSHPTIPDPSQVFDKLEQIFSFIGGALATVRYYLTLFYMH